MVEQKDTMEESVASCPSDEMDAHYEERKEDEAPPASKAHRIALTGGICGILILAVTAVVVVGLVGGSFSNTNSEANADEAFDFEGVGPDFSNIRPSMRPPTPKPSSTPTSGPSETPSFTPSFNPSLTPSGVPSKSPSGQPSQVPSTSPSHPPTGIPSVMPSTNPTRVPVPSPAPSRMPNTNAPITPLDPDSETLLTFCVIADVPYIQRDRNRLPGQIRDQVEGCEFLVHLGDIFQGDMACNRANYALPRDIMLQSSIPTFIVPGDNEWNDCGNDREVAEGWSLWEDNFMEFDTNWSHSLDVVRQTDYQENFHFVRKKTLIFGLNIVGGRVHDRNEWNTRLTAEIEWIKSVADTNIPRNAAGIIILAHARPTPNHDPFFNPLRALLREEFRDIPVLYLHGDGHSYFYSPYFLDEPNALQIQHQGGVRDPILKIMADPFHMGPEVHDSFQVDRQLHLA